MSRCAPRRIPKRTTFYLKAKLAAQASAAEPRWNACWSGALARSRHRSRPAFAAAYLSAAASTCASSTAATTSAKRISAPCFGSAEGAQPRGRTAAGAGDRELLRTGRRVGSAKALRLIEMPQSWRRRNVTVLMARAALLATANRSMRPSRFIRKRTSRPRQSRTHHELARPALERTPVRPRRCAL